MFEQDMREAYLTPFLVALARELKAKPYLNTMSWIETIRGFVTEWERDANITFPTGVVEKWAREVDTYHSQAFIRDIRRSMKVDVTPILNSEQIRPILTKSINDSVGLIKTIPRRFRDGLIPKLIQGESISPMDLRAREKLYREEGKSSGYNLRRITRDQSNKLNGKLAQERMVQAGIDEYVWRTSEDERVRPTHVTKNNQVFSWDDPPPDTGHPGHDIQCRCVAIPKAVAAERLRRRGAI